ncbi:MAG: hypothetical protein U9P10_08415 [Thermodesulfobacteriota bacterium]|nr:hypothetical protein [Thermodesulfobacteriota bacterium]
MKKITLVITALTAFIFFVTVPAAFAGNGNGPGDGTGPLYTIMDGIPMEVSGVVADINTSGNGISIETGSEIVTVYGMGPVFFWDAAGIAKPAMGEAITVNGYEIALSDGTFKIIAMSVVLGGEEIVLRDPETGAPLWRGTKGSGNSNGTGRGMGTGDGNCNMSAIESSMMLNLAARTHTKDGNNNGSSLTSIMDVTGKTLILAAGGNGNGGGHGPGDGTGNGGNGPRDGSGNGNKSGTCTKA